MSGRAPPVPHVAHVLSSFGLGGQERVALELSREQVRAGYHVSVVSLAPPPDGPLAPEFRATGAHVARVARPRPGVDPVLVLRLAWWLRHHRVDLAHTHNSMALIYGAPAARLAGAAVVHTKHGSNPRGGTRLLARKLVSRWVDAFVAVSVETADFARRRREIEERRLSVIPNGISLRRFQPDVGARARVRAELGVSEDAWLVGTVGRAALEKNQALLLRAAAPLLGTGARLVVTGDGPLLPSLEGLAAELGIAPFVHLLGARQDVPDILNALDVFVLSSDLEGLPLVILEAMATGLPVISTRVGGIPTVLDDGMDGYLVDRGDERALRDRLAALRADPERGRVLGAYGRSVVLSRFSDERMQRDYLDLYERVLSRRTGRARPPRRGSASVP
jgi:glycosyltransferase involved in cell wall biosynthesis